MTCPTCSSSDPTLAVAERQLAILAELVEMATVVCRANAAASVAAGHAVETILADEFWQPETGRARALAGAKDAADSFQKASRSLRLTMMLQKTVAEWVRDEQLGIVHPAKDAGGTPAGQGPDQVRQSLSRPPSRDPAGSCSEDSAADAAFARPERERPEFDRPDTLPNTAFRATVERISADLGAPVDWKTWKVGPPNLRYTGLRPKPPGWSECRPPAIRATEDLPPPNRVETALSP